VNGQAKKKLREFPAYKRVETKLMTSRIFKHIFFYLLLSFII